MSIFCVASAGRSRGHDLKPNRHRNRLRFRSAVSHERAVCFVTTTPKTAFGATRRWQLQRRGFLIAPPSFPFEQIQRKFGAQQNDADRVSDVKRRSRAIVADVRSDRPLSAPNLSRSVHWCTNHLEKLFHETQALTRKRAWWWDCRTAHKLVRLHAWLTVTASP